MRVLANENLPGEVVEALRKRGHDIVWIRTEAPGSKDRTVLQRAQIEKRIINANEKLSFLRDKTWRYLCRDSYKSNVGRERSRG